MGQPWAAVALEASRVPSLRICSGRNRGGKSTLGLLPRKFGGGRGPLLVSPGETGRTGTHRCISRVGQGGRKLDGAHPGTSRVGQVGRSPSGNLPEKSTGRLGDLCGEQDWPQAFISKCIHGTCPGRKITCDPQRLAPGCLHASRGCREIGVRLAEKTISIRMPRLWLQFQVIQGAVGNVWDQLGPNSL